MPTLPSRANQLPAEGPRPDRRATGALNRRHPAPGRDWRTLTAIFAGGTVGAMVRVALLQALPSGAHSWPWATFSINLGGAFLLGYFATRLQERLPLSAYRRPLLGTGFCGALTTFSTMQVELLKMLDGDRYALTAGYGAASILLGYAAVHLGTALARRVRLVA